MPDKTIIRMLLVAGALCGSHAVHDPSPASAQDAGAPVTTAVPPADARTTRIVDAADAFLATLGDEQKAAVLFDFTDAEQRARWSNLPEGIFRRTGVAWGDMDQAQRTALMDLLGAVLGPEGVENVREQMAADDALTAPDGAPVRFGSAYYHVSFLGRPSTASPWTLQFGGHHLAINATVVGPNVTPSPSLTGGQPLKFISAGPSTSSLRRRSRAPRSWAASRTRSAGRR
jgi:hypothetical protein